CLTDLGRSKAQEPDRLCVARLGDPPNHVHSRGSQPPDTPRRSRGRERDHAALRYTLPALRSQTHLQETPNRQGRHRRRHQERLTRASPEVARAAQAATTAKKREPTFCLLAPRSLRAEKCQVQPDAPPAPGGRT